MTKKEEANGIIHEQDRLENPIQDERMPEFDEYGTALNDI